MFIAGNDTTASTIAAAIGLLTFHPDIQRALREEVTSAMQGEIPSAKDITRMPLLDAVVSETLRLYPAAHVFARKCSNGPDVVNGYTIKKDAIVFMSPYLMQRSQLWTDPERFDPSRFLPGGEAGSLPRLAWMPFGAGHRSCIGGSLALLETRT
eukprot:5028107-Pyramimonas_sp.AAC.1